LKAGADPEKVLEDFQKDNKISADTIGVVRARAEELAKATDKAVDEHGEDSREAEAAKNAESQWLSKIQPMQTEWSKIGMAQQGETNLDTGTVASIKRAFREQSGKPLTEKQTETAKALHGKIKEQDEKIADLQAKVDDLINKQQEPGVGIKEKAKGLAKKIRDNAKLSRPGIFSSATPASIVWDSAVEVVAKSIEAGGALAEAIGKGIDHIKASDWYKGLSKTDQKEAEKQFSNWHKDQPEEKIDVKTHFVDKKDNNFSPKESKAVWEHAKEVMAAGKTDFHDVVSQVAMDTGLSGDQVRRAISQPKGAKTVTDQMYSAMYKRNQVTQQAKAWVKSADQPEVKKFFTSILRIPAAIVTYGHGSVAPITHVGADLFRPTNWKSYFNFMLNSYKFSFGGMSDSGLAKYENAMGDLVHDPMFIMAKRAGLKIDPTDLSGDDYSKYQGVLGRISKMGERGFNAMKPYRLEQFKKTYDGLSDQAKANPDVVKSIADMVNLSTGTTSVNTGKYTDLVFFAPKLVTSQYQRIFTEPAKAVSTFATWNKATDAQKLQAKMVARHAGEMVATYMAALAANQAFLSMSGSKQNINFTKPLDSDWMKFKVAGKTIDASGGMNSSLRFVGSILQEAARANGIIKTAEKGKPGDVAGSKLLQQLRNKLSPAAGDVAEGITGTDAIGNPLPWSSVKPSAGKGKETWSDYFVNKAPIPLSEGIKTFTESAKENGMSEPLLNRIIEGIIVGGAAGTTGAKIGQDYSMEKKGGSGGGAGARGSYGGRGSR
jgi:low affinity Fe/Cu permease